MLTKVQKKRLAREARKLAMEIVDGTNPDLNVHYYCTCAMGEVAARAQLPNARKWPQVALGVELEAFGESCPKPNALVSMGLKASYPDGAIFPLLALADALEESSEQPPAGPSKET